MVDCRGKQLRVGDLVSVASSRGHRIGTLRYDPDDIRYGSLHLDIGDRTIYTRKDSRRVLNLSALLKDEFDRPIVSVLH